MKALILGATGLVGRHVLARLLATPEYGEVRAVLRREAPAGFGVAPGAAGSDGRSGASAPSKLRTQVLDFENLAGVPPETWAVDHVYCCLGTTIKIAGSQAAFRRVDHDYPSDAARLCARGGASKFLLISSVGASSRSRTFYLRVKGETEQAVASAGLPEVHAFRPSLLLGERAGSRPLERVSIAVSQAIAPVLAGPLSIYRPIEAGQLARVMVARGLEPRRDGFWVHQGAELFGD
jgi:uncharacterized protein YbjT (DUF2867 family)